MFVRCFTLPNLVRPFPVIVSFSFRPQYAGAVSQLPLALFGIYQVIVVSFSALTGTAPATLSSVSIFLTTCPPEAKISLCFLYHNTT